MLGKRRVRCLTPNDYKQFVFSVFYFSVDFYRQANLNVKMVSQALVFQGMGKFQTPKNFY